MKTLITALSILTLSVTFGNFSPVLIINSQKSNPHDNHQDNKEQNTIYINNNGKQVATSGRDLSNIDSKEIIKIGFYENWQGEIQVVRMPKTVQKIPKQLLIIRTFMRQLINMSNLKLMYLRQVRLIF